MQCSTLGNMSVTPRIPNVAFLGLLVSLSLFSDLGFVTAEQIVDTEPHVVLEVGDRGILPCRIQRRAYSVEWKRQLSSGTELLVSLDPFFIVGKRDGPGYESGLFNVTDDYSLVIKDVKVYDEGLYICEFVDYKTLKAFRSSTRVSVQAFPDEPFPTIQECIGNFVKPGVCTLAIHSTSNLTCLVRGYYPNIDLFFVHGSENVTSTDYQECNNADGTKNRNITMQISVSDEPYQCVASRVPGMVGGRFVSVIVHAHSQGLNAAAAAVIVPVVFGICLSMVVIFKCYSGDSRGRRNYMRVPGTPSVKALKGPVSKLELWKLVKKAEEIYALKYLRKAIRHLRCMPKAAVSELQTDVQFYESLCTWKRKTSDKRNQREMLYSACFKAGMADIVRILTDFVTDTSHKHDKVSADKIEDILHLLEEINDTMKIPELFGTLELDYEATALACEKGGREVIDVALKELLKWRDREFDINPLVILSLELDDLPWETDFFKTLEGPISKPELWKVVKEAEESNAFKQLREVSRRLGQLSDSAASKLEKSDDFYESLCEWKRETASSPNQREMLYSVCCEEGMSRITRTLKDFVKDSHDSVSKADIERILWETEDTRKIIEIIKALRLDHEAVASASKNGIRMKDIALKELLKWLNREFDRNPLVALSLKLDNLECKTNFFKEKTSQNEEIDEEEMKDTCCQIFKQHYTYLVDAVQKYNHIKELPFLLGAFLEENNTALFNTLQMLNHWVQGEDSSNYVKRKKLAMAIEVALQRDHTDAKWPPDDELRVIASVISLESMEQLCSKLKIESTPQEASKEELLRALTEWRDNHASSRDLTETYSALSSALKEINQKGMIHHAKGQLVYKAELVDLAFHLFAQDLLPFTEALGISAAKLVDYRRAFLPSHMTQGTIGLVCKLFESGDRSDLFSLMKEMPFPNVCASAALALDISYGEVFAIPAGSLGQPSSLETPHITIQIDDESFKYSQCQMYDETTKSLATVLAAVLQVKYHDPRSPKSLDSFQHFKLWRDQPHLTPFHFRRALVECLISMDINDAAQTFLRGGYKKGRIPITFTHNILHTMDPGKRRILGSLIRGASFTPLTTRLSVLPLQKEEWSPLTDILSRQTHAWIEWWIQQRIQGGKSETEIAEEHKEFNDKLVDHGFLDLAREIMICEQQLIDTKHAN